MSGKMDRMMKKSARRWKRSWRRWVKGMKRMEGQKMAKGRREVRAAKQLAARKIQETKQELGTDIRSRMRKKQESARKAAGKMKGIREAIRPEMELRTDLALEEKERFPGDGGEIRGISLKEWHGNERQIKITEVKILNAQGAKAMGKEKGTYLTIEAKGIGKGGEELERKLADELACQIRKLAGSCMAGEPGSQAGFSAAGKSGGQAGFSVAGKSGSQAGFSVAGKSGGQADLSEGTGSSKLPERILVVGLGNLYVTPDSLGPRVLEHLQVTRHYDSQYGEGFLKQHGMPAISGLVPGVMAQTGMETAEILKGVVKETKPQLVVAIDALSARSVHRLGCTIQLSDTGIRPGSGVGNHRNGLVEESLGVPVLAVGVPTVVGAAAIVQDTMEAMVKALEMGKNTRGAGQYLSGLNPDEQYALIRELLEPEFGPMFVTPPDIDERVEQLSKVIADAVELAFV